MIDTETLPKADAAALECWIVIADGPAIVSPLEGSFPLTPEIVAELVETFDAFYQDGAGWAPMISKAVHEDSGEGWGQIVELAGWNGAPDGVLRLVARVRWTPEGWEKFTSCAIRYVSPQIRPKSDGKGSRRMALVEVSPTIMPLQTTLGSVQALARRAGVDGIAATIKPTHEGQTMTAQQQRLAIAPAPVAVAEEPVAAEAVAAEEPVAVAEDAAPTLDSLAASISALEASVARFADRLAAMEPPAEEDDEPAEAPVAEEEEEDDADEPGEAMTASERRLSLRLIRSTIARSPRLLGASLLIDDDLLSGVAASDGDAELVELLSARAIDAAAIAEPSSSSPEPKASPFDGRATPSTLAPAPGAPKGLSASDIDALAVKRADTNGSSYLDEYYRIMNAQDWKEA